MVGLLLLVLDTGIWNLELVIFVQQTMPRGGTSRADLAANAASDTDTRSGSEFDEEFEELTEDQQEFADYLQATLGIPDAIAAALRDQGLQVFDDLNDLTKSDMDQICKNCRKPGGGGNGVQLGQVQEKRLKMLLYFKRFLIKIQREFTVALATMANLTRAYALYEREKTHDEVEVADPIQFTKEEQAREVIESLENYFSLKYGTAKVPLSYVTRPNAEAPDGNADPGFGNYSSMIDEAIERSRHTGEDFADDNKMVWEVLRKSCHGGAGWAWIKKYKNSKNGRQALIDLKDHYMGRDHQSKIKAQAADIVKSAYYDGKARNFSFSSLQQGLTALLRIWRTLGLRSMVSPRQRQRRSASCLRLSTTLGWKHPSQS